MYGLKEKAIGKLIVKVLRIDKNSEDAHALLNWKLPGQTTASRMAGDFAGRCFEVISKRPMLTKVGTMTIGEVNDMLDKLSSAQKEESQLPIFQQFYNRMNAEELMWLVRIILRQMKVGATEKTFFDVWHPDAEGLFNVSSSLRRVCWELYDPSIRLDGEDTGVTLMQCFQPQLAQFQMHSFQRMVDKMRPTENDTAFWIEEKLDGERMQLHMQEDEGTPGGRRFSFWSRKAKDYTYLYGNGFEDRNGALTRHISNAFNEGVRNVILDGEMITWDPEQDAMVPFGTLKTAALNEQRNPFSTTGQRPLYKVFDILYLNGEALTKYTLRDRRRALEASINSIARRMEIHTYTEAHSASEVEPLLRRVVAEASEGLVLKNPRSAYRLNERNDDWMKVKPEYMTEFGESLDCIVIGGYYGSGHRGGRLSSFLCGLKVDENQVSQGSSPEKCYSFFKVGGGFTAADYANVRHQTDGKWQDWDAKRPPTKFIELGGGDLQYERPDVWIKPSESVVLSVKAASIHATDQFRVGLTLRFPRFKKLRMDKDWDSALSVQEFLALKNEVEREKKDKDFKVDDARRQKRVRTKKEITIAGNDNATVTPFAGPETKLFEALTFCIMTESVAPAKRSRAEIEHLVKANGGNIVQTPNAVPHTICIGERRTVQVASLMKRADRDIIRPAWIFDCVRQAKLDVGRPELLLPLEPNHIFFSTEETQQTSFDSVDDFGDSYARDTSVVDLRQLFDTWPNENNGGNHINSQTILSQFQAHGQDLTDPNSRGWLFSDCVFHFHPTTTNKVSIMNNGGTADPQPEKSLLNPDSLRLSLAVTTARFSGAHLSDDLKGDDDTITHVIVTPSTAANKSILRALREDLARRRRMPRTVTLDWLEECWRERTLIDEERFAPVG